MLSSFYAINHGLSMNILFHNCWLEKVLNSPCFALFFCWQEEKDVIIYLSNKEGQSSASPPATEQRGLYSTFLRENCEYADAGHPLFLLFFWTTNFWRCFTIAKLDHQLNEEIRDKEIRVIGEDGAQLGIMSADEANKMAEEQGLDLVKISPNAIPPVCKIMDYSKFCFDQ